MKYKSIPIRMVVMYFDYNGHIVYHIFQKLHLLLVAFIVYYIFELNLILSKIFYFLQKAVLLVVLNFYYISQAKNRLNLKEQYHVLFELWYFFYSYN